MREGLMADSDAGGFTEWVVPAVAGREAAVTRLMALDGRGELGSVHVRLTASALGVSERTVWSWVSVARREGRL
ncbi:hypothetical protein Slala02_59600 [Streptomyces lavendulae subsp. lavendulae]|nr:hypothetical protein Slala02_59600 [Streptomyces lavendulae subsp. lavendulae]